jgi:hypothetical protein
MICSFEMLRFIVCLIYVFLSLKYYPY